MLSRPTWRPRRRSAWTSRRFALRSLDRILSEAVAAPSKAAACDCVFRSQSQRRDVRGLLDDYAFLAVACLDAYEASADLVLLQVCAPHHRRDDREFYDPASGGFFDTEKTRRREAALGVLATRRKPFQDSPTPAGNSHGGDRTFTHARIHQRAELSRQGRRNAGSVCGHGGTIRNLWARLTPLPERTSCSRTRKWS